MDRIPSHCTTLCIMQYNMHSQTWKRKKYAKTVRLRMELGENNRCFHEINRRKISWLPVYHESRKQYLAAHCAASLFIAIFITIIESLRFIELPWISPIIINVLIFRTCPMMNNSTLSSISQGCFVFWISY